MALQYFRKAFAVGFLIMTLHPLALMLNTMNSASADITASPGPAVVLQEQSFQASLGLVENYNSYRRRAYTAGGLRLDVHKQIPSFALAWFYGIKITQCL